MLPREIFSNKTPKASTSLNAKPFFSTKNNDVMYIFMTNQFVTAVILNHFKKNTRSELQTEHV